MLVPGAPYGHRSDVVDIDGPLRATGMLYNQIGPRLGLRAVTGAVYDPSDDILYLYGSTGIVQLFPDGRAEHHDTGYGWMSAVLAGPKLLIAVSYGDMFWIDLRRGNYGAVVVQRMITIALGIDDRIDGIAISSDRSRIVLSLYNATRLYQVDMPQTDKGPVSASVIFPDNHPILNEIDRGFSAIAIAPDDRTLFLMRASTVYMCRPADGTLVPMYRDTRMTDAFGQMMQGALLLDRDGSLLVFGTELARLSPVGPPAKYPLRAEYKQHAARGPGGLLLYTSESESSVKLFPDVLASDAEVQRTRLKLGDVHAGVLALAFSRGEFGFFLPDLQLGVIRSVVTARAGSASVSALARAYTTGV